MKHEVAVFMHRVLAAYAGFLEKIDVDVTWGVEWEQTRKIAILRINCDPGLSYIHCIDMYLCTKYAGGDEWLNGSIRMFVLSFLHARSIALVG